jgi:nucleoside-diphosphate-sugar epimerase
VSSPPSQSHGSFRILIEAISSVLKAGESRDVDTYIMCPGIIYGGAAVGSLTIGLGYSGITSLAKAAGYMPYVGDGSAVVAVTHVVDAVNFLVRLVERAAAAPATGSAYSRWYNVLTEERVSWKDIAMELARVLEKKGVVWEREARSVSLEEAGEGPFKYIIASNLLMQGPNAAKIGFMPSQPGIVEQMEWDLEDAEI